jgi:hypothetical protein
MGRTVKGQPDPAWVEFASKFPPGTWVVGCAGTRGEEIKGSAAAETKKGN